MKVTKKNIALFKIGDNKYIDLEHSGYELTGNWVFLDRENKEPCIQIQVSDGENVFYVSEDNFDFSIGYYYVRNETKKSPVVSGFQATLTIAMILGILVLSIVGAVTILTKYVPL